MNRESQFLIDEETSVSMGILPMEEKFKVQVIVFNVSFFIFVVFV